MGNMTLVTLCCRIGCGEKKEAHKFFVHRHKLDISNCLFMLQR